MSEDLSRRNFLKVAGATTAGVAIATTYSPFSYAANEKVKVASIGTGGQGSFHLRDGLSRASNVQIVAVCDVYEPHLEGGYQNAGGGKVKKYMDYREMLEKEKIDAVIISTPLNTHFQIAMDCLDADKFVFCEKTMCYSIEQCRNLVIKSHQKGKFLQVGHQRRYNPTYNHAAKLAREEGAIGRINHIDCQWHRNNDWRRPVSNRPLSPAEQKYIKDLERHLNWRLYKETSGGLMTELGTHQIDIASWFLDAMPSRVVGYGGIDYWRDGREVFDNVNVMYEYEITPKNRGYRSVQPRTEEQKKAGELDKPYTVRVVYSSLTANGMKGCSELVQGDDGTFYMTETGSLFYPEPTSKVKWAAEGKKDEAEENAIVITSGGSLGLSNKARKNSDPITINRRHTQGQRHGRAASGHMRPFGQYRHAGTQRGRH
jgi:predicted dehydrogenase